MGQSSSLSPSSQYSQYYTGVKESDTGLAPPNLWDLPADKQRMGEEHPLQVARCTKIIRLAPANEDGTYPPPPTPAGGAKPNADEQDQYVINVKQIAKFVVGLGDRVAGTDIEEGMRVGYDRTACRKKERKLMILIGSIELITRFKFLYLPVLMLPLR